MSRMLEILEDRDWMLTVEFDPNVGGDGSRVRLNGDPRSFRKMAEILTVMADAVDNPEHPASRTGWHLAFNPKELEQFELVNASFLTFDCLPAHAD